MEKLIISLLHRSNIFAVDYKDLHLQLLSHPEYPSLKAITDTLDYFGIENLTAHVPKETLGQLPRTFLALVEKNDQRELALVLVKETGILLKRPKGKSVRMVKEQFLKQWTGTIIAVEKIEKKEFSSLLSIVKPTTIFLTFLALSLLLLSFIGNTSATVLWMLGTSLIGLVTGYFIIKEELGVTDQRIAKLCGTISGTTNGCGTLLNTDKIGVLQHIPLKDIVVVYFASQLLIVATLGIAVSELFLLSAFSMPIVLTTLYLQAFKLKKWCLLCLVVALILGSQFGIMLNAFSSWDFSLPYLLYTAIIVLWVSFGWTRIKRLWKDSIQLDKSRQELYSFKRDKGLFFGALNREKPLLSQPLEAPFLLFFGNEEAAVKVLAITNPLCGYCSEPFETYAKLISQYPNEVQISVVFNVTTDLSNRATQIALQMVELYKKDSTLAWQSILEWFRDRDIISWNSKFGAKVSKVSSSSGETIAAHRSWCESNQINYTPKTVINNRPFPKQPYKVDDALFFIDDLVRIHSEEKITIRA